jgi:glycosyltransferase involved in cell wall biosynthesis
MKSQKLKISVITPSFNSATFIERAIKSVLAQNYANWEHIIMDGGSTDCTLSILKKYTHLKLFTEKDDGQADAMNKGFKKSKGDIIVYLNADDYFFPGAFSAVIAEFEKGAKFVVGNVLVKSARLKSEFLNVPKTEFKKMLRHWEPNAFCHNSTGYFYLREVQEKCPFNLDNYATMDLEFLLDAAEKYSFSKINFTLGCFEDGVETKTGITQSKLDYWKPSTFPYLEKHIEKFQIKEKLKYKKDRRDGYALMQAHMNRLNKNFLDLVDEKEAPSVSVIIPVYNGEKYVCRAVESVLSQELRNMEIIIVDDASSDNTLKILNDKYENNSKVKIIAQQTNKKPGMTRNRGINEAKGKYIFFLDADDWINKGCLKHLMSVAESYKAEITACGIDKVWENGRREPYHSFAFSCDDRGEALNYLADYKIGTVVWNKLYLREFIEKNKLNFTSLFLHEDVLFVFNAIYLCKKYISISDCYCNYFQTNNSIVNSAQTEFYLESYIKLYIDIIDFLKKNNIGRYKEEEALCRSLLEAHCYNDIYPKLIRYINTHSKEEWENDILKACQKILGVETGIAVADFLIKILEKERKMPAKIKNFSFKNMNDWEKIAKKYCGFLLNTKLRGPLIKFYFFIKNKKR